MRYQSIDDIICKNTEQVEADFKPLYPDRDLWSTMFHIEINTVDPNSIVGTNGSCIPINETVEKTHIFNTNIQMQLLAEYK